MSGDRRFVDTSVLLYAHDDSAGAKRDQARALLEQLWQSRDGSLSVQVLQEFFVNATRKIARPLTVLSGSGEGDRRRLVTLARARPGGR